MTDEQQDAAIGALTKRYSDAKRKRAAFFTEVAKAREQLNVVHDHVLSRIQSHDLHPSHIPTLSEPLTYPDAAALRALIDELRAAAKDVEESQQLLRQAGLDVS